MSFPPPGVEVAKTSKKFPSREIFYYLCVQVGAGGVLQLVDIDGIHSLERFFFSVDDFSPTFATAFIQSSKPVASKVLLLFWWLFVVPAGLLFFYKWSEGFRPSPRALRLSWLRMVGIFVCVLVTCYIFASLLLTHDYSPYWTYRSHATSGRAGLVPFLFAGGPLMLSVWLAASSFVLVPSLGFFPVFLRAVFCKASGGFER